MSARKQPAVSCSNCGRRIAVRVEARAAAQRIGYFGSIAPMCLRPHKCKHGKWCDECKERHS